MCPLGSEKEMSGEIFAPFVNKLVWKKTVYTFFIYIFIVSKYISQKVSNMNLYVAHQNRTIIFKLRICYSIRQKMLKNNSREDVQ